MYESFYCFKEKPFTLLPDSSFLFMTKAHTMALTMLEYSLSNETAGICVISGEIGSGKTTLLRKLLSSIDPHKFSTGMLTNTHSNYGELLQWVSMAFDLPYNDLHKVELYDQFVKYAIDQYARGKRTVLIIDEAQNLSYDALEELRMLSNINSDKDQLLQLILVGQPELRRTFQVEKLEQLNQRVTVSYHLSELSQADCIAYIQHRLQYAGGSHDIFEEAACKAIWYHSRGIPRLINSLCDMALVYGFADQKKQIDIDLVNELINDRKASGFLTRDDDTECNVAQIDGDSNDKQFGL